MQLTIPTVQYGNVCPEIEIESESLDEAEKIMIPWVERMYSLYLNKVPVQSTVQVSTNNVIVTDDTITQRVESTTNDKVCESESLNNFIQKVNSGEIAMTPSFSSAIEKIQGANTETSLNFIKTKIGESKKLAPEEKAKLISFIDEKLCQN